MPRCRRLHATSSVNTSFGELRSSLAKRLRLLRRRVRGTAVTAAIPACLARRPPRFNLQLPRRLSVLGTVQGLIPTHGLARVVVRVGGPQRYKTRSRALSANPTEKRCRQSLRPRRPRRRRSMRRQEASRHAGATSASATTTSYWQGLNNNNNNDHNNKLLARDNPVNNNNNPCGPSAFRRSSDQIRIHPGIPFTRLFLKAGPTQTLFRRHRVP